MRWSRKSKKQRVKEYIDHARTWHKWFAWKPIERTNPETGEVEKVWLEEIYRRAVDWSEHRGTVKKWDYIFDDFEMIKYTEEVARREKARLDLDAALYAPKTYRSTPYDVALKERAMEDLMEQLTNTWDEEQFKEIRSK